MAYVRIYLSGGPTDPKGRWAQVADKTLLSYHYIRRRKPPLVSPKAQALADAGFQLFLDSGAYSAFNSGATIDLEEFTDYVNETQAMWSCIASLDVIGDAAASWRNFELMRRAGCDVIPVYHYGEPVEFLERMVAECKYIGIGGVAQVGVGEPLFDWLDHCFRTYICDADGRPKVKVHGFAVTSPQAIRLYPWYSVDSTSWAVGKWGKVPFRKNGRLLQVQVSRGGLPDYQSMHYSHMPELFQQEFQEFVGRYGTTVEELAEDVEARYYVGACVYKEMEQEGTDVFRGAAPAGLLY